jgi:hypothetical protein
MKRLTLNVDALSVVSFPTAPAVTARGTVQAHVATTPCAEENTPACVVTSGINSCWCTEYVSCSCTV